MLCLYYFSYRILFLLFFILYNRVVSNIIKFNHPLMDLKPNSIFYCQLDLKQDTLKEKVPTHKLMSLKIEPSFFMSMMIPPLKLKKKNELYKLC